MQSAGQWAQCRSLSRSHAAPPVSGPPVHKSIGCSKSPWGHASAHRQHLALLQILALGKDCDPRSKFLKLQDQSQPRHAAGWHLSAKVQCEIIAAHINCDGNKGSVSTCRYVAGSSAARKNATSSLCRPIVIWMLFATCAPWRIHNREVHTNLTAV